jgi:hypothetical protein
MQLAILIDKILVVRVPEIHYKSCNGCEFMNTKCTLSRKSLGLDNFVCEGYIWLKLKQNGLSDGN